MEMSAIYFSVKLVSAIYILHKLWAIIFSRMSHEFWDRPLRRARLMRVELWRKRKKRMEKKAREKSRKIHVGGNLDFTAQNDKNRPARMDSDTEDVIGKTNIVYLEDPDMARRIPAEELRLPWKPGSPCAVHGGRRLLSEIPVRPYQDPLPFRRRFGAGRL